MNKDNLILKAMLKTMFVEMIDEKYIYLNIVYRDYFGGVMGKDFIEKEAIKDREKYNKFVERLEKLNVC